MDLDDFRSVLDSTGVDVWAFIDAAITVASLDNGTEMKHRRDGIVERLYTLTSAAAATCRNCDGGRVDSAGEVYRRGDEKERSGVEHRRVRSPSTDAEEEEDDLDPYGGLFDDEQKKILAIKEQLEEPDQPEEALVDLLQGLADMDITFRALKETDIGRHVNRLRKHSSSEVRKLVKHLVRKWKEIVDEWVKLNQPGQHAASSSLIADADSPLQKIPQNGHPQVSDSAYSPNPNNGSSGSDRNYWEPEPKPKSVPPKEAPPRPVAQSVSASNSVSHKVQKPRDSNIDMERLASARKRLQANYKEAENGLNTIPSSSLISSSRLIILPIPSFTLIGFVYLLCLRVLSEAKKQRTIQVMDIHEIPKPKNSFFGKNKGGGSHGKHW